MPRPRRQHQRPSSKRLGPDTIAKREKRACNFAGMDHHDCQVAFIQSRGFLQELRGSLVVSDALFPLTPPVQRSSGLVVASKCAEKGNALLVTRSDGIRTIAGKRFGATTYYVGEQSPVPAIPSEL